MTGAGLVVTACTMLGIREPMEFYALSEGAQSLWIEHAHNTVTGAYHAKPEKKGRKPKVSTGEWAQQAAEAARARGVL
jgi:hypothetical protein